MHIIRCEDYELKPWKNGLGKTREIISQCAGVHLLWRLSLASVQSDGPFSNFAGFERILTVVKGEGMRLIGSETDYDARPFVPIGFCGGESIMGECCNGPVENFNLIFDPRHLEAEVRIVSGSELSDITISPDTTTILHVLSGDLSFEDGQTLARQDTGMCNGPLPVMRANKDISCALVTLAQR